PPPAGFMGEMEEAEIGGELLLRDAAMGTQPGAQQGPEAFRRVDVDFAEAIAVIIPRVLATGVADGLVSVAPVLQPRVDVVLVGVDKGVLGDRGLNDGPDRPLLDVGQHPHDHVAPPLQQTPDRRLLLFQRAPAGRPSPPGASPATPLLATAVGLPLCPAVT